MATVFSTSAPHHRGSDPAWIKTLITGSILALVLISGGPVIQNLFGRGKSGWRSSRRIQSGALDSLRASIVGHGKHHIKAMLGPPRALGNGDGATWYYALDNAERIAMAIVFDEERARAVEFFKSPA